MYKKLAAMCTLFLCSFASAQNIIENNLNAGELSQFKFIALRGEGKCDVAGNYKGWNFNPSKLVGENKCKVLGYNRGKGFLSIQCSDIIIVNNFGDTLTYAKTRATCGVFVVGLENATYDAYRHDLIGEKTNRHAAEPSQHNGNKIERPHALIFSGGYGFANPKGYTDSDKGEGFAAGIDYWYLYSSGEKGISFGASVRRLPFIDASTTIAGQTTKTSVTLYPLVVQLRFSILQLGAGYAPASASVTINDKSASSAASGSGSAVLMAGIGGGGHLTSGIALQLDLCRIYYYPELKTYAGYFGLGIGFSWQN